MLSGKRCGWWTIKPNLSSFKDINVICTLEVLYKDGEIERQLFKVKEKMFLFKKKVLSIKDNNFFQPFMKGRQLFNGLQFEYQGETKNELANGKGQLIYKNYFSENDEYFPNLTF